MINYELFFGFCVDSEFQKFLEKVDPAIAGFFIQDNRDYLQSIFFNQERYLGKFVGNSAYLSDLTLLEANIYSLLKQVVSDYTYQNSPLKLFPVPV